jgi:hypothetical protein
MGCQGHCAPRNRPLTNHQNTRPIIHLPPLLQISVSSPLPQIPSPPGSPTSAIAPRREREPPSSPCSALPSPAVCRVKPTAKLPQPLPASHLPVARNRKTGSSRPPPAKGEGGATGGGVGCTGPWVGQWQRLCRTSDERRCGT